MIERDIWVRRYLYHLNIKVFFYCGEGDVAYFDILCSLKPSKYVNIFASSTILVQRRINLKCSPMCSMVADRMSTPLPWRDLWQDRVGQTGVMSVMMINQYLCSYRSSMIDGKQFNNLSKIPPRPLNPSTRWSRGKHAVIPLSKCSSTFS